MKIVRHDFVVDSYEDGKFASIITETISKEFIVNQNNKKMESFISNVNYMYEDYAARYEYYDYKNKLNSNGEPYPTLEEKRLSCDESIEIHKKSLESFSDVRVLERIKDGESLFYLVYGDFDDNSEHGGTGGFDTLELAKSWFLNGGR